MCCIALPSVMEEWIAERKTVFFGYIQCKTNNTEPSITNIAIRAGLKRVNY